MKKIIQFLLFFTVLMNYTPAVKAQVSEEKQMEMAARTTMNGQPEDGVAIYKSRLNSQPYNADLHYNIGVAYYLNGQLGLAILHHEKALVLRPSHSKAKQNLQLLREEQEDGLIPITPLYLVTLTTNTSAWMPPNAWMLTSIFFGFLVAFSVWYWLIRTEKRRKRLQAISISLTILCVIALLLGFHRKATLNDHSKGVLVTAQTSLYIAPGEDADVEMEIHEGLLMHIIDDFEEWYKVELVDGRQGWTKKDLVEVI